MTKIEKFFNSTFYVLLVFLITFISWSFYKETPPHAFNLYNMIGLFFLVLLNTFLLITYKNTLYTIPIVISFLFIINRTDMTFETASAFGLPIIAFATFLIGYLIHFVRFRPKIKTGVFFLGFFLIALGYVIPLLYTPFTMSLFTISIMGFIYLSFYIFYASTLKGNIDYLFKIMIAINILITAQFFFFTYQGFILNPELEFFDRLFIGWGRRLGWANVNDVAIYLSLTFPAYLYFIFKNPKTYTFWILMFFPMIAVLLSKSRGGMIGFVLTLLAVFIFFVLRGNKKHLLRGLLFITFSLIIFYVGRTAFYLWCQFFLDSFGNDLNSLSSGRIEMYLIGLDVFKQYPLFGGGWLSLVERSGNPMFVMYHSTIVHALAAMGLFGFGALIIHYYQVFKYMFVRLSLEKSLFLIGYLATQIHGLIDNTQYSVMYSVLVLLFLSIWETSPKQTIFKLNNHRYHLLNETV